MLPSFIIEQIRKREVEERKREKLERAQLPLPAHPHGPPREVREDDDGPRGVVVIDLA